MTDNPHPIPGTPEANDLVIRGNDGDPVRRGTVMTERESWERVHEGLKLAADAAAHLACWEQEAAERWGSIAHKLDQVRRAAVQKSGYGLAIREKQTQTVRIDPLRFKVSRRRFVEGLRQASGGMRQLATCHRSDMVWSRMAFAMEAMAQKAERPRSPNRSSGLILPYPLHG